MKCVVVTCTASRAWVEALTTSTEFPDKAPPRELDELLDKVGLLPRADSKFHTCSLCMKQGLGLVYALHGDPELLSMDEPISGMDTEGTVEILGRRLMTDMARASVAAESLMMKAVLARREGRAEDARRYLSEAASLYRRAGAGSQLAQTLRTLGEVERDVWLADTALGRYQEAVAIYRDEGAPLPLAHMIRHLGQLHYDAARVEDAERCYREAIELYRACENPPALDLANAIRPLAILEDAAGHADDARRLFEEAKLLYQACGVQAGVDECATRLSRLTR